MLQYRNFETSCGLLVDGPQQGAWNMAVDEALLEAAAERGEACWRFYAWSAPTLSLGYFQEYVDRQQHPASRTCRAVRRLTGGGAILHDADLTYSLVLPSRHPLAARRDCLYAAVHGCLVQALGELGITAGMWTCASEEDKPQSDGNRKSQIANRKSEISNLESQISNPKSQIGPYRAQPIAFLCFQRRAAGDVLLGPDKIAGSAQRRRRGAILQHGSLLVRRSAAAPELPGLEDLAGRSVPRQTIQEVWLHRLGVQLGLRWAEGSLSQRDCRRAEVLVRTRYAQAPWIESRSPGGA
jgi:lipoate-protein ligase A